MTHIDLDWTTFLCAWAHVVPFATQDPVTHEEIEEDDYARHARHDRLAWKAVQLIAAKMAPKVLGPVPGQKRSRDDSAESEQPSCVASIFLDAEWTE